jgi:hypothetical protein
LDKDILMGNDAGEFKITDGEVATGVSIGHEASLDGMGEWCAPEQRRDAIDEPHTTHTRKGSIDSTNTGGIVGDDLEIASEGFKVIELRPDVAVDVDAVAVGVADTRLEGAE